VVERLFLCTITPFITGCNCRKHANFHRPMSRRQDEPSENDLRKAIQAL
jgi:hypothetical protein